MAEKQYQLSIKNVDVTLEEGHFFKVLPFVITIENVSYDVVFEKGLQIYRSAVVSPTSAQLATT